MGSSLYVEDVEKIDYIRSQASELVQVALNPAQSADFVTNIIDEYDREARADKRFRLAEDRIA